MSGWTVADDTSGGAPDAGPGPLEPLGDPESP